MGIFLVVIRAFVLAALLRLDIAADKEIHPAILAGIATVINTLMRDSGQSMSMYGATAIGLFALSCAFFWLTKQAEGSTRLWVGAGVLGLVAAVV